MNNPYDAMILVSFGGPEGPDDVMPFLENVLRGRDVPRERMLSVAEHYYQFGGVSPINHDNRRLVSLLEKQLSTHGMASPVYFGNRNWHPMLADTIEQMKNDGVRRALAIVTSGYSSYSSCRQYKEDIEVAREAVGEGAPEVDKLRVFFNHPGFIESMTGCAARALEQIDQDARDDCHVLFTAHSIPLTMSDGCAYAAQMEEVSRLVSRELGVENWRVVYQSRSGPPQQPWLEPDICDAIRESADKGASNIVVVPVGFISAHMEILFDIDTEAQGVCDQLGIQMVRADTVGHQERFIEMLCQLISERICGDQPVAVGNLEAPPHVCAADCCPVGARSGRPG
ncbi:MAG: ferrochelatase [Planctomycetota bacterium]|nr:ferrochelatase [Planctomycetota bacterium]